MNERIRELYLEAHSVREYPQDDPMRGGNPPTVYWQGEVSAEKFAELIVQECLKLNSKELSITAIERLLPLYKEHFGVE
jgi:hypothetical protein